MSVWIYGGYEGCRRGKGRVQEAAAGGLRRALACFDFQQICLFTSADICHGVVTFYFQGRNYV